MTRGRERDASSDRDIPTVGWRATAMGVKDAVRDHNVSLMAAGVAFFAMLSLAPALAAFVSVYGLVSSPDDIVRQVDDLSSNLPDEARELLVAQLEQVARTSGAGLGLGVVIGLVLAFWSASAAVNHLITAINVAYRRREERGPIRLRAMALVLTIVGIVFMSMVIFVLTGLPGLAERAFGDAGRTLVSVGRWPALALMMLLALAVLYRVAPVGDDVRWRWFSWGATAAAGLWLLASAAFSFYASRFGSYNETYGTMAAIVILMLWLYLSALCIVLGAEINAEMEQQATRRSTVSPGDPAREGADVGLDLQEAMSE